MKIIADQNIPFVHESFGAFGEVITCPSGQITRSLLIDADILLVRSVTSVNRELLEGTSVRFVGSSTIGIDHVDTEYLGSRNIAFAHAPGSNATSVAEYVCAALLEIARMTARPLGTMTLGVIGMGNVGSRVAQKAVTLGMNCLANDPPKQKLTGDAALLPLGHVLQHSDIITVHVPLVKYGKFPTVQMIHDEFISSMKPGASLINTSRGAVLDERSLRGNRRKLGAVVLDVWGHEPAISMDTLAIVDIATPHIAGYSYDGKIRGTEMIHAEVCRYLSVENRWASMKKPDQLLKEEMIDARGSDEPVWSAVSAAYAITADDSAMRRMIDFEAVERAEYFTSLRKNYRVRLEFPHYTVLLHESQSACAGILKGLGFKVDVRRTI